jgi:hypothetical protein
VAIEGASPLKQRLPGRSIAFFAPLELLRKFRIDTLGKPEPVPRGGVMKRLYLIVLLATMAQSAAALSRQQEQVISATGFALFVGD